MEFGIRLNHHLHLEEIFTLRRIFWQSLDLWWIFFAWILRLVIHTNLSSPLLRIDLWWNLKMGGVVWASFPWSWFLLLCRVRPLLHLKAVYLQSKCWLMMSTITIYISSKQKNLCTCKQLQIGKKLGTSNKFDGENKMILQVLFLSQVQWILWSWVFAIHAVLFISL